MNQIFPEPIRNLPEADIPLEGITAYLSQSETHQIVFMQFKNDVDLPEYAHAAQVGLVLEGRIELVIDGKEHRKNKLTLDKQAISEVSQSDLRFWMSLVHWSARTLFFRAKGVIGSKTQACQWCTEQAELDEFQAIFNFAKSQRFPYENVTLQEKTKISCSRLLDLVDT